MYRVPYLRFAALFPICSFSSGVKCWYGDRLDVSVVTSHVTTAYNFAEKTFTNWLQTAKFAKVFSLESFLLYGTFESRIHKVAVELPNIIEGLVGVQLCTLFLQICQIDGIANTTLASGIVPTVGWYCNEIHFSICILTLAITGLQHFR